MDRAPAEAGRGGKRELMSPRKPPLNPCTGVIRIDYEYPRTDCKGVKHTAGYTARIMRQGTHHTKLFSDGVYGGWFEAMSAAVKWRRQMERKLPEPWPPGREPKRRRS